MNFNISHLKELLLPTFLQKVAKFTAWIDVYFSEIDSLYEDFLAYREEKLFLLAHNSQVAYIEHYLNHLFNPSGNDDDPNYKGNGIYIDDADQHPATFLFLNKEQGDPTYLYPTGSDTIHYLFTNSESAIRIGYTIWIPYSFTVDNSEVEMNVKLLSLAGKHFSIKNYAIK